jgi:hypothetical protein
MILLAAFGLLVFACSDDGDDRSERFRFLTGVTWESDSLLVDGSDASGPGQRLEKFKGEARFREDGTGTFGEYSGTWNFAVSETTIEILTDSLPGLLTVNIEELTASSLKVTTFFPNFELPDQPFNIRMTFKAK